MNSRNTYYMTKIYYFLNILFTNLLQLLKIIQFELEFKISFSEKKYTGQFWRMLPQKKTVDANGNSFIKYIGWFSWNIQLK